jgi:F-type H+-transporting ATPase subunit a
MLNTAATYFVSSPLEQFEVISFINLNVPVLGYLNIALTNLGLYTLIVLFLAIGLHLAGNNEGKLVPSF